ncbi:hypothetical protein MBLNU459_g6439t1 [Dothideomycetes sp. NU459]
MLGSSTKSTRIATGIIVSLILFYFALHSIHQRASHIGTIFSTQNSQALSGEDQENDFVTLALRSHVTNPYSKSAISSLCTTRQPRDDIAIRCAPGTGGIGNIRSYVLHCVRFAIETGATRLLVPRFHRRSSTDLFELNGELADFEHFFDRDHFRTTLQEACPHIQVMDSEDSGWTIPSPEVGIPEFRGAINESSLLGPSPWRAEFDAWVVQSTAATVAKPVVLTSYDPGRGRAVLDDGIDFYYNFGRVLELRPDVRRLAATAMREMARRFGLYIDPAQNIYRDAFFGAHLRTSDDAVKAGWNPDFDEQTDHYLAQATRANLKVVYAAGGNDRDLRRFAEKAARRGVNVVNKYDLLARNDLSELVNLSWDQRGLLDLEILMKASAFGGYTRSSFSHNVAFRRHFLSEIKDPFSNPKDRFVDELSRLYGRYDSNWETETLHTMWP